MSLLPWFNIHINRYCLLALLQLEFNVHLKKQVCGRQVAQGNQDVAINKKRRCGQRSLCLSFKWYNQNFADLCFRYCIIKTFQWQCRHLFLLSKSRWCHAEDNSNQTIVALNRGFPEKVTMFCCNHSFSDCQALQIKYRWSYQFQPAT